MPHLTSQHDELTAVVRFVSDEIRQDVPDVQGQIAPYVGPRWWHRAAGGNTEVDERLDPLAAAPECGHQLSARHLAPIEESGNSDPVFPTESPNPLASCVMKVCGDHADRAPGNARDRGVPEARRQAFDEESSNPAIRPPGGKEGRAQIVGRGHAGYSVKTHSLKTHSLVLRPGQ